MLYKDLWGISLEEHTLMKKEYLSTPCQSRKKHNGCGNKLHISRQHSTGMAFQLTAAKHNSDNSILDVAALLDELPSQTDLNICDNTDEDGDSDSDEDSDVFNNENMDNDEYSTSMDEINDGSRQLEVNKASDNPNTPILSITDTNPIFTSETVSGDTVTMSDGDEVLLTPPTVVEMEEITTAAGTIGPQLCALEGAEIASCGECELLIDDSMNWVECSRPACSLKGLLEKPLSKVRREGGGASMP
ncbi:hypothetical protein IW262DRAFT_1302785 [Armillaria fumosa]|nr:hypothetical protein IW262DRAFT_1302785 [Armillaria fumosa]